MHSISARETAGVVFITLNDDCFAQNRPRELKLVSLELSGNKVFEFTFPNVSVNEIAMQNIGSVHNKSM